MSWFRKPPKYRVAALAAANPVKAPVLVDGGVSIHGAKIFKANIGHATVKHVAILFAIVVADTPEEAGELLLRWSKGDGQLYEFISNGAFILEEVSPHLKGVL